MNTTNMLALLIDDLAADWTEPALEILKDAGLRTISVETELDTWRALQKALRQEMRWQRSFRVSTLVSLRTLREQVLRTAVMVIAREYDANLTSYEFEMRIRGAVADVPCDDAERGHYARMVQLPSMPWAFKGPTRTDYTPRLQVTTMAD